MIWRTHWRLSWYSLLHLYAPETFTLTVHRLVGHVQILQNDSNCNTTNWHWWNTVGLLRRPFLHQTASTNVKYSSIFHRLLSSLWPPQVVLYTVFHGLQTWAFKFLRTTVLSLRDFSGVMIDVPIISKLPSVVRVESRPLRVFLFFGRPIISPATFSIISGVAPPSFFISIPGNIQLQCKQSALGYPIGANSNS